MSKPRKPGTVPLVRAFSKLGIGSRKQAEEWILAGKVSIAGRVVRDLNYSVNPERAAILLEGKPVRKQKQIVIMLHKPRGVVTTNSDEKSRKTVFDLLDPIPNLHSVGRLDMATTGLLLLTNDSRLSSDLTNPNNKIPRIYLVTVRGKVSEELVQKVLRQGVTDNGELLQPDALILRKASEKESHLTITLCEGKNREIRRIFECSGHEVTALKRVSYGGLDLGSLEPGKWRILELKELQKAFSEFL